MAKILIVDDEEKIRTVLKEYAEFEGHECAEAEDGMQAPYEAMTGVKKERLLRGAKAWLAGHDAWGTPCRFDLVCVTTSADGCRTELIRNVIEYTDTGARHAVGGGNASWQPW